MSAEVPRRWWPRGARRLRVAVVAVLAAAGVAAGVAVVAVAVTGGVQAATIGEVCACGSPGLIGVRFSPDGRTIAVGGGYEAVVLVDVKTRKRTKILDTGHDEAVFNVAFSPDGKTLAAGLFNGATMLWEVGSGRQLATFPGERRSEPKLAFDPSGTIIATTGLSGRVQLWDVRSGNPAMTLTGEETGDPKVDQQPATGLAFAPDGRTVAAVLASGRLQVWDVTTGARVLSLAGREDRSGRGGSGPGSMANRTVVFAPDGKTIVYTDAGPAVQLLEVATGKLTPLAAHRPSALDISPDGRSVAMVGDASGTDLVFTDVSLAAAGSARRLELASKERYRRLGVAFGPDGATVVTTEYSSIQLWSAKTGVLAARIEVV